MSRKVREAGSAGYLLTVKGLTGGHSGMDIHRGRGNANKLLNRLLLGAAEESDLRVGTIDSGGLRNAIPREGFAHVVVEQAKAESLEAFISEQSATLKEEYAVTDPNMEVSLEPADVPASVLSSDFQEKLLRSVYGCFSGVFRMSPDIDGLVQTSNNLARVLVSDGKYEILCLTRGSVDSEKMDLACAIRCTFELIGGQSPDCWVVIPAGRRNPSHPS